MSIAINIKRTNKRNNSTTGFSINAGCSPESIKYSTAPKMIKNAMGTLTQDGTKFLIIYRCFGFLMEGYLLSLYSLF